MRMTKNKNILLIIYLVLFIFLIAFFSTISKYHFLNSSFKIDSHRDMILINLLKPKFDETESLPLKRITFINVRNKIFFSSDYTLSFYVKTKAHENENINLFYSTNNLPAGSIYWNINVIEGRLQMSRACGVPIIFVEKNINNDNWHHILIKLGSKNVSIYFDNELVSSSVTDNRCVPENWFVINTGSYSQSLDKIFIKDFTFIGSPLSPNEFESYAKFFSGNTKDLTLMIALYFIFNFSLLLLLMLGLVFIIKNNYPSHSFLSIIRNITYLLPLLALGIIPFWIGYGYWISFLCFQCFTYLLIRNYKKILPGDIRDFVEIPILFIYECLKLLVEFQFKELLLRFRSLDSVTCFYLLFCLGFSLSFNYFISNIIP
jgi:hypothetical protein